MACQRFEYPLVGRRPPQALRGRLPTAFEPEVGALSGPGVIDSARIRWRCPNDAPDCKPPATYFRENARLYTYLPHGGNHERRKLRDALVAYRNVIEAGFAWAEDLGLADEGLMRPRWAKDPRMEHFAWMVAVSRTARKVIHEVDDSGSSPYDRVRREAEDLGLTRMSTAEQPGSNIAGRTDAEVTAMRQQLLDTMRPPAGWEQTALRLPQGWPSAGDIWQPDDDLTVGRATATEPPPPWPPSPSESPNSSSSRAQARPRPSGAVPAGRPFFVRVERRRD